MKKLITILMVLMILPLLSSSTLGATYVVDYSLSIWFADSGGNQVEEYTNILLSPTGSKTNSMPSGVYTTYETIYTYMDKSQFSSCEDAVNRTRVVRERYFYEYDLGTTKDVYSVVKYPDSCNELSDSYQLIYPTEGTFNGNDYNIEDDLTEPTDGDDYIEDGDSLDIIYYVQVYD